MSDGISLVDLGKKISTDSGHYNGGPKKDFELVGRDAMKVLLNNGLLPSHRVLDFGCGSLRLGYWLIRFLDPGRYFGLEPIEKGVDIGLKELIGDDLKEFKKPNIRISDDNDMEAFEVGFDFVIARSILTHTCPGMLNEILRKFSSSANQDGVFLASYWRVDGDVALAESEIDACRFISVIGDDLPVTDMRFVAFARYSLEYVKQTAAKYGLNVEEDRTFKPINKQIWLKFTKCRSDLPERPAVRTTHVNKKTSSVSEDKKNSREVSLMRARENKELRTKNEIANFSRSYRMPMFTNKAGKNAFVRAAQIVQGRSIENPINFGQHATAKSLARSLNVLTICCGAATTEKALFTHVKHKPNFTIVDINQDLLNGAKKNLSSVANNVATICGDANEIELPEGDFDVAICVAGLHHIVELEHLYEQLAGCLKKDGEFWSIGEYIGRNGARLWPESYEVANGLFSQLPEKYRINNVMSKQGNDVVNADLLNVDCSETTFEGIRAEEVEEILLEYFEPVRVDKWSTIAWRVVGPAYVDNYDMEDEQDQAMVEKIANIDADMFLSGKLRPVGMKGIYRPI